MRPFREIITLACIIGAFIANAGDQVAAKAKGPADRTADAQLQLLQGRWEGAMEGDDSQGKVTITITGDLLHFRRDTNFWFKTTIALPKDTDPKQLHATIKECPPPQADSLGKVVGAIFKIEDGELTLLTYDMSGEAPNTFAGGTSRYVVKRVGQQKGKAAATTYR